MLLDVDEIIFLTSNFQTDREITPCINNNRYLDKLRTQQFAL